MGEITAIDHIGVAVRDLEAAAVAFRALGLAGGQVEVLEAQQVRLAFFQIGQSRLELLEPLAADSPVGRFLASRGEGVHHLAFRVGDVALALERAVAAGLQPVDRVPREGAGGARVAFLHPKGLHGVLVEFCERAEGD